MEKWGYVWPKDEWGNRKHINNFSDLEHVRYLVYLARLESTLAGKRHIRNEIMYLHNWYSYFSVLTKTGQFDPECLKYLSLEIVRLYKESSAWQ